MKRGCNVIVLVSPPSECEKNVIVVGNEVLLCSVIDHVTLTFEPQNSTTSRESEGHSLNQVWTLWDHLFLSYAADKQTDSKILPIPTDIVGVGNYNLLPAVLHLADNYVCIKHLLKAHFFTAAFSDFFNFYLPHMDSLRYLNCVHKTVWLCVLVYVSCTCSYNWCQGCLCFFEFSDMCIFPLFLYVSMSMFCTA